MNDGLQEVWRERIMAVLQRFPKLARAYVYGSRATGTYRRASDLDLALESTDGEPLGLELLAEIRWELDEAFVPITVDVVDRAAISNPAFAEAIARDSRLWWEREGVGSSPPVSESKAHDSKS